jgi:hypothetical protein
MMYFEPPLGGTFELYQSATDNIVQWIASTARTTGTASHLLEPNLLKARRLRLEKLKDKSAAPVTLMSRTKNRKRHQAKPTGDGESPSTMELSYGTLFQLGKAIACTDGLDVEFNVLVLLHGIIHARKGFAT